jgi:DNA invertase Pin-like site-specific DNA recombinase
MKVALYARVSTEGQDPEVQIAALRAHAANRDWQVVEEFVDRGYSGAREHRPALDRLMRAAWAGQFQAVLVWRFDRFARSVKHLVTALDTFCGLNVAFISLQEQLDTSSPIGQAMFTIIGAMAQLECDIIRERVVAGLERAKARGRKLGRPRVAVDAAAIRALKGDGLSLGEIARRLRCSRPTLRRRLRGAGAAFELEAEAAQPPGSETPAKKPRLNSDDQGRYS